MPDVKTRQYSFKINGIEESIQAVDTLSQKLDALGQKLDALDAKAVNVKTSGGGGGASSTNQSDKEELKTQEEIVKELELQKQLRKQLSDEAKDMLAADRLNSEQYTNTMAGLKQELSDLKRLMQHTDLGSEAFGSMTKRAAEITQKLKDIEASYGTFSRNVGNYASAFDGLKGVTVTIGGVERSFNSTREASRTLGEELKAMVINGQQDSAEFKQLETAVKSFKDKLKEAESALKDLDTSSKVMDNLLDTFQSLTAIASVGNGLSALFGFDNSEIERSIQKLVALQNILKGIETIKQQMNANEGLGAIFAKGSEAVDAFTNKLFGLKEAEEGVAAAETAIKTNTEGATAAKKADVTATNALTAAETRATVAATALNVALKALGIGLIIGAIALASEGISMLVDQIKHWITGDAELYNAENRLANEVDFVNDLLDERKRVLAEQFASGEITKEEMYTKALEAEKAARDELTKKIIDQYTASDKLEESVKEQLSFGSFYAKNAEQSIAAMDEEVEKLEEISDKTNKQKEDLIHLEQQAVGTFVQMAKSGKYTNEELKKIYDSSRALQKAFANLDDDFPDEQLSTMLRGLLNQINQVKTATVSMFDVRQADIDVMEEGLAKINAQYKLNQEKINANLKLSEEDRQKLLDIEAKKYNKQKADWNKKEREQAASNAKKLQAEAKKAEEDLTRLRIQAIKNGHMRTLAELDFERQQRIDKAREMYKDQAKLAEAEALINQQYDQKKLEATEKYQEERIQALKEYENTIRDIYKSIEEQTLSDMKTAQQRQLEVYEEGAKMGMLRANPTLEFTKTLEQNRKFLQERLKMRQVFAEDEKALEIDLAKKETEAQKEAQYEAFKAFKKDLDDRYKNEEITLEEHQKLTTEMIAAHKEKIASITRAGEERILNIETSYKKKNELVQKEYFDWQIQAVERQFATIGELTAKQPQLNALGMINLSATRKNYQTAIDEAKKAKDELKTIFDELQENYNKGKIDTETFQGLIDQLLSLQNEADEKINEAVSKKRQVWQQSVEEWMGEISKYAQQIGNAFQEILTSMWDTEDAIYEKRLEDLEKFIDQYDELLEKQQEITERHTDKVNDIEDELSTARGDRRDELIDALGAQIQAQRKSLAEEKRLELEKEQLEKQKDKEEAEHAKKEKQRALIQAIISGALAVVNGFATVPFIPAGVAAGALAAAVTAVQIANIMKQQTLAEGGVIEGPSHAAGGVKVLGGRAEVEGGEFITNKKTTEQNADLLYFINSRKHKVGMNELMSFYSGERVRKNLGGMKFAAGGALPSTSSYDINSRVLAAMAEFNSRPTVVSVVDILDSEAQLNRVRTLAGEI